jgi:hypothetical protein
MPSGISAPPIFDFSDPPPTLPPYGVMARRLTGLRPAIPVAFTPVPAVRLLVRSGRSRLWPGKAALDPQRLFGRMLGCTAQRRNLWDFAQQTVFIVSLFPTISGKRTWSVPIHSGNQLAST